MNRGDKLTDYTSTHTSKKSESRRKPMRASSGISHGCNLESEESLDGNIIGSQFTEDSLPSRQIKVFGDKNNMSDLN